MSERARLLAMSDRELLALCEVDRYRASGPGGQKRNKTESAVRIRHPASGISAHAAESRSQHDNRASALARLREKLALELREPVDLGAYRPPPELRQLVVRRPPPRGAAYLIAVGQLLDLFVAAGCAVSDVAERLSTTTGAVSKLLTSDDRLLRRANELRAAAELKPLRP